MEEDIATRLTAAIEQLPPVPETLLQLRRVLADPASNYKRIIPLLERDPGLAADVLKFANSARCGVNHSVTTLGEAVLYVGTGHLSEFVSSAFAARCIARAYGSVQGFKRFLEHSQRIADGATHLLAYTTQDKRQRETLVLISLLHDIGKLVVATVLSPDAAGIGRAQTADMAVLAAGEQQLWGVNHCEIGAAICTRWHFPEVYRTCIREHHTPVRNGRFCPGAAVIFLAHMLDAGIDADVFATLLNAQQLCDMGLSGQAARAALHDWTGLRAAG